MTLQTSTAHNPNKQQSDINTLWSYTSCLTIVCPPTISKHAIEFVYMVRMGVLLRVTHDLASWIGFLAQKRTSVY
jgi:hypothetical protein